MSDRLKQIAVLTDVMDGLFSDYINATRTGSSFMREQKLKDLADVGDILADLADDDRKKRAAKSEKDRKRRAAKKKKPAPARAEKPAPKFEGPRAPLV